MKTAIGRVISSDILDGISFKLVLDGDKFEVGDLMTTDWAFGRTYKVLHKFDIGKYNHVGRATYIIELKEPSITEVNIKDFQRKSVWLSISQKPIGEYDTLTSYTPVEKDGWLGSPRDFK